MGNYVIGGCLQLTNGFSNESIQVVLALKAFLVSKDFSILFLMRFKLFIILKKMIMKCQKLKVEARIC